jgi:hypothetical protein
MESLIFFAYCTRTLVSHVPASRFPANRLFGTAIFLSSCLNLLIPAATVFDPKAVIIVRVLQVRTVNSHSMGARNQVGIGMSYRPASIYSLATQFQTRFLRSIPRPIAGLKFSALESLYILPQTLVRDEGNS